MARKQLRDLFAIKPKETLPHPGHVPDKGEAKEEKPAMINCPKCGMENKRAWRTCFNCGHRFELGSPKPKLFFPLRGRRKEYMLCTNCGQPIKEEPSYYDIKQKVFLHTRCKEGFMKKVAMGEA